MKVRDYSQNPVVVKAVEDARNTIIACWTEWDADASEAAQIEQDNEAWFSAMNAQLDCVLYGMLDDIPDSDMQSIGGP
jgi:hypothetical protein